MRSLALAGRAGQKLALPQGLLAERAARELRLSHHDRPAPESRNGQANLHSEYTVPIPGEIDAPAFGLRLRIELSGSSASAATRRDSRAGSPSGTTATLRNWKPGDRVRLRHSAGPRKVKEVLERLRVTGTDRAVWPVLEDGGRIVWMRGVELEPEPGLAISASFEGGAA